jgi:hypothetical protein
MQIYGHYLRGLATLRKSDPHNARIASASFVMIHQAGSDDEKRELEAMWTQAEMGPFPPPENS